MPKFLSDGHFVGSSTDLTIDGQINISGQDINGVTSPTLYLGQLTNAYQAGMQSSVHLTMKTTNNAGNFYWYRTTGSVMYYSDALYVNKIVDKDNTSFFIDPGSASSVVHTGFKINAPDEGGAPAMTAILDMHGYEGRGVGIKMKDNVNSASGSTDREWFVGTGYNTSGFNIGYASDGSQSSYAAQAKLAITTGGDTTVYGKITAYKSSSHTAQGTFSASHAHLDLYNSLEADTDQKGSIITFTDNYFDGTNYIKTTRAGIKGGTDTTGNTADGYLEFYTDSAGANSPSLALRLDRNQNATFLGRLFLPSSSSDPGSSPAISFDSGAGGIWYDDDDDHLWFRAAGNKKAYVSSAGIISQSNVYTGSSSQFRNYAGVWAGTTGTANNGFYFLNTANSNTTKAMDLSHDGNVVFNGYVRGTMFADKDATSFYVNPGAGANSNAAVLRGQIKIGTHANANNTYSDGGKTQIATHNSKSKYSANGQYNGITVLANDARKDNTAMATTALVLANTASNSSTKSLLRLNRTDGRYNSDSWSSGQGSFNTRFDIRGDGKIYAYGNIYTGSSSYFGTAYYAQSNTNYLIDPDGTSVLDTVQANYFRASTTSTSDPILRLTDAGVANYDVVFPDTNTYRLETDTSSTKTFRLHNAGSGNFKMQADEFVKTGGTSSQFLMADGSVSTGGGTATTINNNADNRVITGSGTADTLEAESGLTFDGDILEIVGSGTTTKRMKVSPSTDYGRAHIGRAALGKLGFDDHAGFAHEDHNTQTNYALLQSSTGNTYVNAASGKAGYLRINNSTIGYWNANGIYVTTYHDSDNSSYFLNPAGSHAANLAGRVDITTASDVKMRFKTPSTDTTDWNYIEFYKRDGNRASYFGINSSGNPIWAVNDGGPYIKLEDTGDNITAGGNLTVTGDTNLPEANSQIKIGTFTDGSSNSGIYDDDDIIIGDGGSISIFPHRRGDYSLDATTATSTTFRSKLNIWSDNEDHITFGGASTHMVSAWENWKIWINNDSGNNGHLKLYHTSSKTEFARLSGDGANSFVLGTFKATGDLRAPIFYDSNDTNYYVDPASTSVLNNVNVAGNITLTGAANEIIKSNGSIRLNIDSDNNQTDRIFIVSTGSNSELFRVDESGAGTFAGAINNTGDVTITNGNVIFSSQYGVRFNDANTRIYTNTDSPEDLIIEADQDLLLTPDGQVSITGNLSVTSGVATITQAATNLLTLTNSTNGGGAGIVFDDHAANTQKIYLRGYHSDGSSQGGGASLHLQSTEPDLVFVVGDSSNSGRIAVKSHNQNGEVDYGFYSDTNTGMYSPAAGQVGLVSDGSRKLLVNNNGVYINNGNLYIPDHSLYVGNYIYHDGDTNTHIYFASDRQVYTAGGTTMLQINKNYYGSRYTGLETGIGLHSENLGGANLIKKGTDIAVSTGYREEVTGPDGNRKVQAHVSTGSGTGSNPSQCYQWYSSENVVVNPEKDYEFSVWVKSEGDHNLYLGWHEYNSSGTQISSNPYFHTSTINTSSVRNVNGWVLLKYQLKSHRTSSGTADTEGSDRYVTHNSSSNFRPSGTNGVMHSTTKLVHIRMGTCYGNTNTTKSYFYNPKITEAQHEELQWTSSVARGFASESFRAPIFYDNNDTTYYIDPSSTSTSLSINGNIQIGGGHTISNDSNGHLDIRTTTAGKQVFVKAHGQLRLDSGNAQALTLDSSQNATFAGKVKIQGDPPITPNTNFDDLVITDSAHAGMSIFSGGTDKHGAIYFGDDDGNNIGQIKYLHDNDSMTFGTSAGAASLTLDSGSNAAIAGDLTVSGGDISLGGTGRIQGVDTVSAGTDAVNKNYVDNNFASADTTYSFNFGTQLSANTWTDTGIDGGDMLTGTYIMQVEVTDHNLGGGHYTEYYSGVISWMGGATNSTMHDEIPVHRAGHAPNNGDIQFRTLRASGSDTHDLMLQVKHNMTYSGAPDQTGGKIFKFHFRKMI